MAKHAELFVSISKFLEGMPTGGWIAIGVIAVVLVAAIGDMQIKIRCACCGFRARKHEYSDGRCPKCNSLETGD